VGSIVIISLVDQLLLWWTRQAGTVTIAVWQELISLSLILVDDIPSVVQGHVKRR